MLEKLAKFGVLPVVAVHSADQGLRLCEALATGGLHAVEITFRTAAAAEAIRAVVRTMPELTVGAGTVLNTDDLAKAIDAGATFAVAPGCNPAVLEAALDRKFGFAPGVATASDIERALAYGVTDLKFFPAEAAGGVPLLKALCGPYGHLGLQICPTGGIKLDNMPDYLALPQVPVVGGSWLAPKDKLEQGDWHGIARLAREAVETVARLRNEKKGT
jgi:2-dehydro-3-deoxyphosphogluconate aldolase/(4S)-4-hydroxy-2-oxoglutarate aldolase